MRISQRIITVLGGAFCVPLALLLCLFAATAAPGQPARAFADPAVEYLSFPLALHSPVHQVLGTADIAYTEVPGEPNPENPDEIPVVLEKHAYTFAVTQGSLPAGLTFSLQESDTQVSLVLTGTPSQTGESQCAVSWSDATAGTTLGSYDLTIGVFSGPAVTVTVNAEALFDDEQAKFDATATGGTGDFTYRWFMRDTSGKVSEVGSNLNYLFYPAAGTLSRQDSGLTFYCEVTDNLSGLSGVSAYTTISVSCRHNFGDWAEQAPATCTEAQVLAHTCAKCGLVETKTGKAALGHTWDDWRQADAETMVHTCTACGEEESQDLVAGTPFIKTQPQGGAIFDGESLALKVEAETTGLGTLSYQWLYSRSLTGDTEIAQGSIDSPSFTATRDGYYRVRITQSAGSDANTVDSAPVYVHVHTMSVWMVETDKGTATRVCLADDCPDYVSETITLDEMMEQYPDDAEALGLSKFKIFVARHKLAMLVTAVIAAFLAAVAVVLLALRRRQH